MKQITFNDKPYEVPTTWEDVTVGMAMQAAELSELLGEAPLIAIISAYTNIPLQQLKSDKSAQVHQIEQDMQFIYTSYVASPQTSFEHKGVTYSCSEDLIHQPFEDWVSVQTALFNYKARPELVLPRLVSIMCKKEGETLDDFELVDRQEIMKSLSLTKAKDIECFFLTTLQGYKSITLLSSTETELREIVLHKVNELQNTMKTRKAQSGTFSGTRLRIGIYQLQLWWVKRVLVKYFNYTPSKPRKRIWKQIYEKLVKMKPDEETSNE